MKALAQWKKGRYAEGENGGQKIKIIIFVGGTS